MKNQKYSRLGAILLLLFAIAQYGISSETERWQDYTSPDQVSLLKSFQAVPATFYVSLSGNDDWSGRLPEPNADKTDGPFRTFEKAKTALREYRSSNHDAQPTVIEVMPGIYELDTPLTFDAADSGTKKSPVIWRAAKFDSTKNEPSVFLRGGKTLTNGTSVTDNAERARLNPEAADKIIRFDLRALGITDYGEYDNESNIAELFQNNKPMTIARYPNEGFIDLNKIDTEGNTTQDNRGTISYQIPKFFVEGKDVANWASEPDAWAHGYWCWDWLDMRYKIVKVDPEHQKIELGGPYHEYGYRIGQYYYVYHILSELDIPGEYYIDSSTGVLYFYPPEETDGDSLFLTVQKQNVIGTNLSNFAFCGFGLDGCRETAVSLEGRDLLVCNCLVRNIGGAGIKLTGPDSLVFGNHLYNLGSRGITFSAGDTAALTHGKTAAVNNDIHHYARIVRTYAAGVSFDGCGIGVFNNRITNAPHTAIIFSGNDNHIELNEIADVCRESNDAGAIYTGRTWTTRGNVINNNYIHDISGFRNKGAIGVYLDDLFSSAEIAGNLFVNVNAAIQLGGGRDNIVVNNIFVECSPAIKIDSRGMNWQRDRTEGWGAALKSTGVIDGIDVNAEPYASAYPELRNTMNGEDFHAPEGTVFSRNVVIRNAWNQIQPAPFIGDDILDESRPFVDVSDNIIGDYRLLMSLDKAPTPQIPNTKIEFHRIPTESIGRFPHSAANGRLQ